MGTSFFSAFDRLPKLFHFRKPLLVLLTLSRGQTVGACTPEQDPNGSSSGSGVPTALGLAFAALDTDTGGSIVIPSSFSNIVGIRPTVGLIPPKLVITVSEHQDLVGPMARTVKDVAYMLQAIAGKDAEDSYTSIQPFDSPPDYIAACDSSALPKRQIGIPRNLVPDPAPQILKAFESAIITIKEAGATIVNNTNNTTNTLDLYNSGTTTEFVLEADFLTNVKSYLSELTTSPNLITPLADVHALTQRFPAEDYPSQDTSVWDSALRNGSDKTFPAFWSAYKTNIRIAARDGIIGALTNNSLDALILPTGFAPDLPVLIGAPVITVPLGFYPPDQPVKRDNRGLLVVTGPDVPFRISFWGDK